MRLGWVGEKKKDGKQLLLLSPTGPARSPIRTRQPDIRASDNVVKTNKRSISGKSSEESSRGGLQSTFFCYPNINIRVFGWSPIFFVVEAGGYCPLGETRGREGSNGRKIESRWVDGERGGEVGEEEGKQPSKGGLKFF